MHNDQPSRIAAAWVSVITANPLANDVVRPWLEIITTTTDPRKKRELTAWCYGAAQLAVIVAQEGEDPSAASIAELGRSWIERAKTDPDPFTILQVSRWFHGASAVALALRLEKEHQLYSKIEAELFDLFLGNTLTEAGNQGGKINA